MRPREFDELIERARLWTESAASSNDEGVARTLRFCAGQVMEVLRHADTEPGLPPTTPPEGEPFPLPSDLPFMRWPTNLPKAEDK